MHQALDSIRRPAKEEKKLEGRLANNETEQQNKKYGQGFRTGGFPVAGERNSVPKSVNVKGDWACRWAHFDSEAQLISPAGFSVFASQLYKC